MKKLFLILALVLGFSSAFAQMMPPIPVDSAVRIGKLPNGLTYYIRHNEKPKGQADFYIAQKVGSILEDDNQRGLAHFLEHMCFNGTENFPGNGLIDWLESVGVKFGRNLNAYTSVDQTVYNISNVPVDRSGVQDTCLLILHDWADGLLLDPEEIEKERGVIHEEWRQNNRGQMRILENLLPTIYPNNKYGERLPIGTLEVIDNFPPQAIRDYYEKWYRPDQQGVIVVGDIDPDYIESKIVEIFSPIQMPANPAERVYVPVEDNEGTIYAIGSDPEQQMMIAQLMFKTDAMPDEMKTDMQYMLIQYMINMVDQMLNQRLTDVGTKPETAYSYAGSDYGNFFLAKTKDALNLQVLPKNDNIVDAMADAYRELLRAQRGGFTIDEYERARAEYLSQLEKNYNGRENRENNVFVNSYVNNFVDNEPIPSIEDMYQLMSQIAPMIPVDAINSLLPELVQPNNRVLMLLAPESEQFTIPTAEQFEAMFAAVDAENIEPYKDEMKSEPLIPMLPAPGKVTATKDLPEWGATELTLSNGVKVVVKHTDFKKDDIQFSATALSGTSKIGDERANELIFLDDALSRSGLGTYTAMDISKYLQGKQSNVGLNFQNYITSLRGNSSVKDLPTLLELIYAYFTEFTLDEADFNSVKDQAISILANQASTPDYNFAKKFREILWESAASQMETPEVVSNANREETIKLVQGLLDNAANFTFLFVGDVTVEALTPLLEQYIATLPANLEQAIQNVVYNEAREFRPGTETNEFSYAMQTPQTTCLMLLNATVPFNTKNDALLDCVSQILSKRMLNKIREEMGAVYSIGAYGQLNPVSKYNAVIQIYFPMKPEYKDEVLNEINSMLTNMCSDITADELNPVKEYLAKNITEAQELNDEWRSAMVTEKLTGVDTWHGALEVVNAITIDDVQNFLKDFLAQGNKRTIIQVPTE